MKGRELPPSVVAHLTPLARALRDALAASGKSQGALAEHLELSLSAIANVCTARRLGIAITEEHTREAARFLGTDEAALLRARRESMRSFELRNTSPVHARLGALLVERWENLTASQAEAIEVFVRKTTGVCR